MLKMFALYWSEILCWPGIIGMREAHSATSSGDVKKVNMAARTVWSKPSLFFTCISCATQVKKKQGFNHRFTTAILIFLTISAMKVVYSEGDFVWLRTLISKSLTCARAFTGMRSFPSTTIKIMANSMAPVVLIHTLMI